MEEKNWNPETRIEVPIAGKTKPPKVVQGFFPDKGGRMDEKDWARHKERNVEAFLPEGRTEVPLVAVDVKINEKKDMAFVDTLAMQTKLGVRNRAAEQSMSMRDSEIVRARNISSTTPFAQGGTATIIGDAVPRSILQLDPQLRMPGYKAPVPGGNPQVQIAQPPAPEGAKPVDVQMVAGVPKHFQVPPPAFSCAVAQQPPPQAYSQQEVEETLLAELKAKLLEAAMHPMSEKEARQKLAEIQRRIQGAPAVPVAEPVLPPPPVAEAPKHQPIIVEPKLASKPVVVEVTPIIDQSERVAELEAENATLLSIVTRLAAENKALKAKK